MFAVAGLDRLSCSPKMPADRHPFRRIAEAVSRVRGHRPDPSETGSAAGPPLPASVPRRIVARAVDSVIAALLMLAAFAGVWAVIALTIDRTADPIADAERVNEWFSSNLEWVTVAAVAATMLAYETTMLRFGGATVGKRLMRLRVEPRRCPGSDGTGDTSDLSDTLDDADGDRSGAPPLRARWVRLAARTLLISGAFPPATALCAAWTLTRHDRRGPHDIIAGTTVTQPMPDRKRSAAPAGPPVIRRHRIDSDEQDTEPEAESGQGGTASTDAG